MLNYLREVFDEGRSPRKAKYANSIGEALRTRENWCGFIFANLIVIPLVLLIYVAINAEGLRAMIPFFAMPLHRVAGFGGLQHFAGWSEIDLGEVTAVGLFVLMSWCWFWLIGHLRGTDPAVQERRDETLFFLVRLAVTLAAIAIELCVFYTGLAVAGGGLWSDLEGWSAAGVSLIYVFGLAALATWHSRFHYSEE